MHAYIVSGGTQSARTQLTQKLLTDWHISPSDTILVEQTETSIGIATIRALTKQLLFTPLSSPFVVALIRGADRMTPEAQNALLKTLEEPPAHTKILLEVDNEQHLLPTVVSRSMVLSTQDSPPKTALPLLAELLEQKNNSIGNSFSFAERHAETKEILQTYLEEILTDCHAALGQSEYQHAWTKIAHIVRQIDSSRRYLASNVSYKAVADIFFSAVL